MFVVDILGALILDDDSVEELVDALLLCRLLELVVLGQQVTRGSCDTDTAGEPTALAAMRAERARVRLGIFRNDSI